MYEGAEDPADKGMTIEEQMNSIQEYCNKNGYKVVAVYCDREESQESSTE